MESIKKAFRVNRKEIAYLKFILEGYEGLAVMTTLDSRKGTIILHIAPGCQSEIEMLLQNLEKSVMIEPVL